MVRNRPKQKKIGKTPDDTMREAVSMVIMEGLSTCSVTVELCIKKTTLQWYIEKAKNGTIDRYGPNYDIRKVFSNDQEAALEDYLIKASKMCYGFTPTRMR